MKFLRKAFINQIPAEALGLLSAAIIGLLAWLTVL